MPRPRTLFTGQWADLPLAELAPLAADMGYDGLELACWGDHFEVDRAVAEADYCDGRRELLAAHGLSVHAISNHLVGQCVCDEVDERHRAIVPERIWADGDPEGVRTRAAAEMQDTARAAAQLGVGVVNGFTGSRIWPKLYFFPPTGQDEVDAGYRDFAERWNPILDVFDEVGVRFGLEVHPSEIAYDTWTTERAFDAVGRRAAFGLNFDPSHLVWQGIDPVRFLDRFADRVYHVHVKDVQRRLDGDSGILASHLPFGDHRRGWDFRSPGRGEVDFEEMVRVLNRIGYAGPLSVEWEDPGMDRVEGAREAAQLLAAIDVAPAGQAFDSAFAEEGRS